MKILIFTTLFLVITNFLGSKALAQKATTPYVVNPLVSDTLTLEERDYYLLFPQIEGFQWAVFYLNSDSSLNAYVNFQEDGISRDTLIENYKSLKSLNYHIYARNALENKSYVMAYEDKNTKFDKGADVNVYMNNGLETSGELLCVRENSLLILKPECNENSKNPDCISKINTSEINKLIIEGNSNVAEGLVLGVVAALATGAIISQSNHHSYQSSSISFGGFDEETVASISIAAVCCIGLGAVIGILTSTPDEVIEPFSHYNISGLSAYSRYQSNEPSALKKIE